jgi:hypothetical protein
VAEASSIERTTKKPKGGKTRPLWMSLWRRPFSKKTRPRTSQSQKILFPDNSLLIKIINDYPYVYPIYERNNSTPFEKSFWHKFYLLNDE